jgi:hypothetical protein
MTLLFRLVATNTSIAIFRMFGRWDPGETWFRNGSATTTFSNTLTSVAGLQLRRAPSSNCFVSFISRLAAAKALTKAGGDTQRWGLMFPATYHYCGWITSGLVMSNDGQYFNHDYGGEVYYNAPSSLGALTFLDTLVNRAKVMPSGVSDANACTTAFFVGRTGMIVLSTGSLIFVRKNMKLPYRVAFMPRQFAQRGADRRRLADFAEGQFTAAPGRCLDPDKLADKPGDRRRVEPIHRLFRAAQGGLRSS